MKEKVMKMEKSDVTKTQLVAVTILSLVGLAAGIFIAGLFGNFSMKPSDMSSSRSGSFSTSTVGLMEAKTQETVLLKNGDSYNLTAGIVKKDINGHEVKTLAYNGSIPGPILKVAQGATITIHFTNNLDVATTLHFHGIRDNNAFDGVPGVTQKEIPVGGTFSYKLTFPDAGVYFYHAHVREDYTQPLGLYGNFLVAPTDPNYYSPVNKEVPVTVSDVLMDGSQPAVFNATDVDHTLMGKFGNTMLINGETNYSLQVNKGEVIRFYFTNTANVRPFNLAISGAKMKLVGADNGKYEQEQFVDSVLLGPSERAIVEVLFSNPGIFNLINQTPNKTYQLGTISVSDTQTTSSYATQFATLRTNQDIISSIDPLRGYFNKPDDKSLALSVNMQGMNMGMEGMNMGDSDKIEWEDTMGMMNTMADKNNTQWKLIDTQTGKQNMDINWQFKKGEIVKIKIFNDPNSQHPMQHPIHIHGQRFLVLSTNGVPNTDLVYKDTVLIQKGDTVELLVKMDNPGNWVIHCHIPEHMEAGMMTEFKVM